MSWQSWSPGDTALVQTVKQVKNGLAPPLEALSELLSLIKQFVETALRFMIEVPDIQTEVLKAAINTLQEIIDDIVSGAGCYFLAVPLRLVNVAPEGNIIYQYDPGGAETLTEYLSPPPLRGGANMSGGNWGFLKDVADSLQDRNDSMRPQLDSDAHIFAMVVLAGSSSYLEMLPLIERLQKLFGDFLDGGKTGAGEGFIDTEYPYVSSLRTEFVPKGISRLRKLVNRVSGGTGGIDIHPYALKLKWDLVDRSTVTYKYSNGGIRYVVTKVVVYRKEVNPVEETRSLEQELMAMTTDQRSEYELASFEFDGLTNEFFDDTIELNKTYVYGVGYEVEVDGEDQGVRYVTTALVDVPSNIGQLPRGGTPPDWVVLPSPLTLIPGFQDLMAKISTTLELLEDRVDTGKSQLEEYVNALAEEVQRYVRFAQQIVDTVERIVELLTMPDIYIGVNTFSGKGGNALLLNKLGEALNDTTDPNRPPFDSGDEVVTGFILYAGAETAGKIQAFAEIAQLLISTAGYEAADLATETADKEIRVLDDLSAEYGSAVESKYGDAIPINESLNADNEQEV